MNYSCKECGRPVSLEADVIKRRCNHDNAGVIAECNATVYGEGQAQQINILQKIFRNIKSKLGLK